MLRGLSLSTEFKNGSPLWYDKTILNYHEIIVHSNGLSLPSGLVAVRYIFSMLFIEWKTLPPFAIAAGLHGIVDIDTEITVIEIIEIDGRPALDINLERKDVEYRVELCL